MTLHATRRRQAGGSMIEFSIGILVMATIIFSVADLSMAVFLRNLLQHSAREGVRWAVTFSPTYNGSACATQTACITQVVQNNAMSFLNGANASCIKINYYTPDNLSTPVTAGQLPKTVNGVVINYVNQTGNVVEVVVSQMPWKWIAIGDYLWPGKQIYISAAASDVLQSYPVGQTSPPAP